MMEEFFSKIGDYGILGILVVLGIIGIVKSSSFLGSKLFDDDKGILTRWVNGQLEFIKRIADNQDKQTAILEKMDDRLVKIEDQQLKFSEAQIKTISILDKLSSSKNGISPK